MILAATALLVLIQATALQPPAPPLDPEIRKLGDYVAAYGKKASVLVGVETYIQNITSPDMPGARPRRLIAEFAIVKAGGGWIGYRDVVEVNGEKVGDRRDRLERLLTQFPGDGSELMAIANESARYNVGPVATNLNVPTTALFFFQPVNLPRFTFIRKGSTKIDGVETVQYDVKEIRSPTLVMTRAGKDVPIDGTLWIVPADGAVVRTRLRMRGFADATTTAVQQAPDLRAPVITTRPTGGREALAAAAPRTSIDPREIRTAADIEVTYAKHERLGLWLPAKMVEQFEGAIKTGTRPAFQGIATTRASYSDFKQFGTGATVKVPRD
jgi:hypothetical protein